MSSVQLQLPTITIQHDFLDVVRDIQKANCTAEDIWISCYRRFPDTDQKQKSVHGKVRVTLDEATGKIELEARLGVSCRWAIEGELCALLVGCSSLQIPDTLVKFPAHSLVLQTKGVDCMDVTPQWIATGASDGSLRLDPCPYPSHPTSNGTERPRLETRFGRGHVGDLTSVQFVLLTTSTDLSARIFSVDVAPSISQPGLPLLLNPRTFAHPHTRALTAAVIIGIGEQIATASRDGKVRVWHVGKAEVTAEASWPGSEDGTHVCAMTIVEIDQPNQQVAPDTRVLILALSSGLLHFMSLPNLGKIEGHGSVLGDTPLDTLALSPLHSLLAVGSRKGIVTLIRLAFDADQGKMDVINLTSWQRSEAGITSIAFDHLAQSIVIAGSDGLPYRVKWTESSGEVIPEVVEEWASFDCDPVSCVRFNGPRMGLAAGKDGSVKVYEY